MTKAPFLLALSSLALGGCLTLSDFTFAKHVPEQTLEGSPVEVPLETDFPLHLDLDVTTALDKAGDQAQVMVVGLTLDITQTDMPTGDTDDWSFLDEMTVTVESTKDGTKLPVIEIARVAHPGATTHLIADVDGTIDLVPYIREGCKVSAAGVGRTPADDLSFDGEAVIAVHPNGDAAQ